jgi:hypothetical protein
MEEFIHDLRVEWLSLQTEDSKKYFAESEELRTSGKSGESSRVKRMYTDLFVLFGGAGTGHDTGVPRPHHIQDQTGGMAAEAVSSGQSCRKRYSSQSSGSS